MSEALSITRTSAAYQRVRAPAERLAERLLLECRDLEAQAVLNLLRSHHGQRSQLTDYHNRLQLALAAQARLKEQAA
jgi:hypothetical protein